MFLRFKGHVAVASTSNIVPTWRSQLQCASSNLVKSGMFITVLNTLYKILHKLCLCNPFCENLFLFLIVLYLFESCMLLFSDYFGHLFISAILVGGNDQKCFPLDCHYYAHGTADRLVTREQKCDIDESWTSFLQHSAKCKWP